MSPFDPKEKEAAFELSRREVLATLGTFAAGSLLFGCASGSSPSTPPPVDLPTQPVPAGPVTAASVSISSTATGTVPTSFAGLSYEKSKLSSPLFSAGNTALINLFKLLGPGILRIGGNSVDRTNWNAAGPGHTAGETAPSDVDSLAGFAAATGWPVLYGVNLGQSTPAVAAAEVAYAVASLGSHLYGIEIGNEPDLYPKYFFPATWGVTDYLTLWESFASAIVAQTPGVSLTGPVSAYKTDWFSAFAATEGSKVILLSDHYYRANGQAPTSDIDALISYPDTVLLGSLPQLKVAATAAGLPFRMAETNSFYNGGSPGVSDSFASALWVLDHMFTIAAGGGVGLNLHGGGDSTGYTPIADNNGVVIEARPEYYGVLLFTLAGQGSLLATTISAASLNASAYTVQNSAAKLSLIVVNKDATQNLQFTTTCPSAVRAATLEVLTGTSLAATTGQTIQGSPVNADGTFTRQLPYGLAVSGATLTGYVPAASAALVLISLG